MDSEVRQIQLQCLKILDIVDKICIDNDIKYSLCGGSVVGAHLYGGCLPWDDDVDLMMTRENYDKFTSIASNYLPKDYSIHNYRSGSQFSTPFTKIMNKNTTIIQNDGIISGVFLDITVYDRIPINVFSHIDFYLWKLSQIVMIGKIQPKNLKDKFRNFILSTPIGNRRKYLIFFEYLVKFLSKSSKSYNYSELFGAFANTTRFSPNIFENYTTILFEGKQYMIVRDYIEYLKTRYNRTDFREPKEKQIAPHYKYVDLKMPHREFLSKHGKQREK